MRAQAVTTLALAGSLVASAAVVALPAASAAEAPVVTLVSLSMERSTIVLGPRSRPTATYTAVVEAPPGHRVSRLTVELNREYDTHINPGVGFDVCDADRPTMTIGTCTWKGRRVTLTSRIIQGPADVNDATAIPGRFHATMSVALADPTASGTTIERGGDTVRLVRRTKVRTNARPEPVRRGATLTVGGRLLRTVGSAAPVQCAPASGCSNDDARAGWRGYRAQRVGIYFDPAGTAGRRLVTTVTTGSRGYYSAKVTAKRDGRWSTGFVGNFRHAGSTSVPDRVNVI